MSRQVLAASLLITVLAAGSTVAVAVAADDDHGNPGPGLEGPTSNCSTRSNVLRHLASKYSESPIGLGVAETGGVLELLTSSQGNTWTIIITMPNGRSCMIAAGAGWQQIPKLATSSRL